METPTPGSRGGIRARRGSRQGSRQESGSGWSREEPPGPWQRWGRHLPKRCGVPRSRSPPAATAHVVASTKDSGRPSRRGGCGARSKCPVPGAHDVLRESNCPGEHGINPNPMKRRHTRSNHKRPSPPGLPASQKKVTVAFAGPPPALASWASSRTQKMLSLFLSLWRGTSPQSLRKAGPVPGPGGAPGPGQAIGDPRVSSGSPLGPAALGFAADRVASRAWSPSQQDDGRERPRAGTGHPSRPEGRTLPAPRRQSFSYRKDVEPGTLTSSDTSPHPPRAGPPGRRQGMEGGPWGLPGGGGWRLRTHLASSPPARSQPFFAPSPGEREGGLGSLWRL